MDVKQRETARILANRVLREIWQHFDLLARWGAPIESVPLSDQKLRLKVEGIELEIRVTVPQPSEEA